MKKLSVFLALLLAFALVLTACGGTNTSNTTVEPDTTTAPASTDPTDSGLAHGTVFDCVADFHTEDGQSGVWQYYFSGDNGETLIPAVPMTNMTAASGAGIPGRAATSVSASTTM